MQMFFQRGFLYRPKAQMASGTAPMRDWFIHRDIYSSNVLHSAAIEWSSHCSLFGWRFHHEKTFLRSRSSISDAAAYHEGFQK